MSSAAAVITVSEPIANAALKEESIGMPLSSSLPDYASACGKSIASISARRCAIPRLVLGVLGPLGVLGVLALPRTVHGTPHARTVDQWEGSVSCPQPPCMPCVRKGARTGGSGPYRTPPSAPQLAGMIHGMV